MRILVCTYIPDVCIQVFTVFEGAVMQDTTVGQNMFFQTVFVFKAFPTIFCLAKERVI